MNIYKRIGSVILSLLLVFSMFGSTLSVQTFATTLPLLSIENKTVNTDEQFTVAVYLTNVTSVYGGNFTLQYDSSLLSVDSYEFGSIVSGHTKNCNLDYQSAGNLIRFTFSGASALSSDGTLVTFTFTAKSKGSAKLQFNAYKMYDENGGSIEPESSNGTINVIEPGGTITGIYNDLLSYSITDDEVTITRCDTSASGSVTIPATIEGLPVTTIGEKAFDKCSSITSVTIPDTVTSLYNFAFRGCTNLISIEIPDSVTSIDNKVFYGCSSLVSINVEENNPNYSSVYGILFNKDKTILVRYPEGKTNIEYSIPSTVLTVNEAAFLGCKNLTNILFSKNVVVIGDSAFQACQNLINVVIGNGVTSIGNCAFSNCFELESVTISDSVTSIGYEAFYNCTNLSLVIIGDGVTRIGNAAFMYCESLTEIEIPDSVIDIEPSIFRSCTNLSSVIIGDGATSISDYCFDDCYNLSSVVVGKSVTKIGYMAFDICSNLSSINFPDGVTYIDDYAFNKCSNLKSVTIPDGVTTIGFNSFYGCTSLTSIKIPNSVTSISNFALGGCTNLTSIVIPGSVRIIGNYAFDGCTNLVSVTLGNGIENIGEFVFSGCSSLASISIPESVTNISRGMFYNCEKLSSIIIPESVTNIDDYAFSGCDKLSYVYYTGLESEWDNISIGTYNDNLTNAKIHYNATGHSYGDWNIVSEASCLNEGLRSKTCSVCGYVVTETISITGHLNTMWVTEVEPTCTEDGYKDEYCLDCGELIDTENIPATGHLNTTRVTEQEPSCSEPGYKDEYCLDCGELIGTQAIPATGHLNTTWVTEKEPSCTENGYKDEYCLDCGEKIGTESIPATGHKYSTEWTIDVAPTCTEEGSKSHLCTVCGEKGDVTVIIALGHDFKVVSTESEHPHTTLYKCSRCTETKEETSVSSGCAICNFTYTNVDDTTCKITGYIGSENSFVIPGTISGRTVTTTTTGAFKNNTTLVSVKIEDGVQGLGSLAFLGCKSLSKIVIPESVVSIGANAFYNCASDFTIYCFQDSYAMQYAIDNSFNYVIMDVGETENSRIDYINKIIFTTLKSSESIEDIIYIPSSSMAFAEASLISGKNEYLGTGSIVTVFDDNNNLSEYTLIVEGDLNGDSICNVLDAFEAERASNGHIDASTEQIYAANGMVSDEIDASSYQNVVNKALAS